MNTVSGTNCDFDGVRSGSQGATFCRVDRPLGQAGLSVFGSTMLAPAGTWRNCILLLYLTEYPGTVAVSPSGRGSSAPDPDPGASVLARQVERDVPEDGDVLGTVPVSGVALVLAKGDGKHPLQAVFDP